MKTLKKTLPFAFAVVLLCRLCYNKPIMQGRIRVGLFAAAMIRLHAAVYGFSC